MAREITRDMADVMIDNYDVLESCKSLDKCIIMISFNLSNEQTLIVQYHMREQRKAYFLDGPTLNIASKSANH